MIINLEPFYKYYIRTCVYICILFLISLYVCMVTIKYILFDSIYSSNGKFDILQPFYKTYHAFHAFPMTDFYHEGLNNCSVFLWPFCLCVLKTAESISVYVLEVFSRGIWFAEVLHAVNRTGLLFSRVCLHAYTHKAGKGSGMQRWCHSGV